MISQEELLKWWQSAPFSKKLLEQWKPSPLSRETVEIDSIPVDTLELSLWRGHLGLSYAADNGDHTKERGPFLDAVMEIIDYDSVLEVGCNLGYNIAYLGRGRKLAVGVEPLYYLLGSNEFHGVGATAFALPFADNAFDLVFVAGVLCHIAQENLPIAISECVRVCKKKLLVVDYYSETETPMPFRGTMFLWSRDFVSEVARIQQTNVIQMGLALGWSSMQMSYAIFDKI